MGKSLNLREVIDIEKVQKIQDDIAEATQIAMIVVDNKGIPITRHSNCSYFCEYMRSNKEHLKLCQKCDSIGGEEANKLNKPYIYKCYNGVVDFASPIIIKGEYLGAVMAGQVLIKNDEDVNINSIYYDEKKAKAIKESDSRLIDYYNKLEKISFDRIKSIANMMFHICNYIVEEGVLKITQQELAEKNMKCMEAEKLKAEIEKEYNESKLKMLQSQMQPHFLFNILNSISSLAIIENCPKIQKITYDLSKLLRYNINKHSRMVSIEEELEYVQAYLNLQKVRFGDRLSYKINVDEKLNNMNIPFMTIQPFVENSIIHGIEKKELGGVIEINCIDSDETFNIIIKDTGVGIDKFNLERLKSNLNKDCVNRNKSIGMGNVNRRLSHYYKKDFKINIESNISVGTTIKIIIPRKSLG
ncbi:sensor histidine kinase [Clostridium tarantellae]|uniref:Histidine kinase n=1 Tax=Clostridium tarantellae TaxID=39493 RepID=A0A6I1MIZ1_9CLOT|nr:PocR ligand-binding domain-containing protein [Clostridium tarantellae]MPQ43345.1 histidine kinase [Clostridium tarantellae]